MEILLNERRTSISYRDGSIFRKYYKYADGQVVMREGFNSLRIYECGIHTPRYIRSGYSKHRKMHYNEFIYHDIARIEKKQIDCNMILQIQQILNKMPYDAMGEEPWTHKYIPDLYAVSDYIPHQNS